MSLDDQFTRGKLLDRISSEYKIPFNEDQKKAFRLQESWGMDVNQLPQFLSWMQMPVRNLFNQDLSLILPGRSSGGKLIIMVTTSQ